MDGVCGVRATSCLVRYHVSKGLVKLMANYMHIRAFCGHFAFGHGARRAK